MTSTKDLAWIYQLYNFNQRCFFSRSGLSSLPPNVVYRSKPTKSCTPTLGGQKTIKCLNNFDWDCSLLKAKASRKQDELGECTRLIFLMEYSTKLNLQNDILPDMRRISPRSNFPRFLLLFAGISLTSKKKHKTIHWRNFIDFLLKYWDSFF